MQTKNQQDKKNQTLNNQNNYRAWTELYLDMVVRGLIAFFFAGILLYAILVGFFHISPIYTLPIAFIVSILISPFLSKIKFANKILTQYENWLEKIFDLQTKPL